MNTYNHTTVITTRVWYRTGKIVKLQYKEGGEEVRRFLPLNFFVFSEDGLHGAVGDFKLRDALLKGCRVRRNRNILVVPPQRHNPWERESWRLFVPPQTDFRTAYQIVHGCKYVA